MVLVGLLLFFCGLVAISALKPEGMSDDARMMFKGLLGSLCVVILVIEMVNLRQMLLTNVDLRRILLTSVSVMVSVLALTIAVIRRM